MNKADLIEKYIQNKASAQEQAEIKRLLEQDTDFKNELLFQLELREAVKREERQQLKERLQNLEPQTKVRPLFPLLWKVACVLVVGLGLLWFFNQPTNYDKLYTEHFQPYPNIVAPTVRGTETPDNSVQKAFNQYDIQNYKEAIPAFEQLYQKEQEGYANFYYAMSLMADNQTEQAIKAFENPNWEIPEKYQTQTNWYLALGYLKLKNTEKAKNHLQKVIQSNGTMKTQAEKLLRKI